MIDNNTFKSKITFYLNFTVSKLLAYMVFIASVVVSLVLSSADAFIIGSAFSCSLMGAKSLSDDSVQKSLNKYANNILRDKKDKKDENKENETENS